MSRRIDCLIFIAVLLLSASGRMDAQNVAPQPVPETSPMRPEAQPSLTVDRDPISSPDTEDNQPVSPANPTVNRNPQNLERGAKGGFTLRRDVEEVVLNCTVLDDDGHLVNDLTKDSFKILEDNIPQSIASFQHQDIPISLGIVVDNSGSMRDMRYAINIAALDLVKASNPQDETFIVNFSDEAFIDQDFTSDIDKLREGLSHIESKGGTALYDALVASADQLAKYGKRPKQVLLIITDGEDTSSSLNLQGAIRRIQDLQGPVVYSIGLLFGDSGSGRQARRAKRAMQILSSETGGMAFFPRSLRDVDSIAAKVAHDIRNQYTIGYHSTKPASVGGFRSVKVEARAPGRSKLIVRTRSGYFPRPPTVEDTSTKDQPCDKFQASEPACSS